MRSEQVDQALCQKSLIDDEHRLFWNDREGELADYLAQRIPDDLAEVTVVDVAERDGSATKPGSVQRAAMSLGGNIVPLENLAEALQVAADAGCGGAK